MGHPKGFPSGVDQWARWTGVPLVQTTVLMTNGVRPTWSPRDVKWNKQDYPSLHRSYDWQEAEHGIPHHQNSGLMLYFAAVITLLEEETNHIITNT
jgi:hypothetical protein